MRAFRRPVSWTETKAYLAIFEHTLEHGGNPVDALRTAYRAILCSARFMYLHEEPGPLDQYALAARLSYFLWNSMPDAELIACAQREQLTDPSVIKQQLSRMLRTSRGSQFIADFANEWLELDEIDFTVPDRKLYPDFDITVQNAMLEETNRFLQDMLDRDANVQELLRCDYAFVNSRLASFYELPAVSGNDIRRVSLPAGSHRGGLLAQGAILKVTANGTNTSPVLRGVWVSRRILGRDIPPPPSNVPAIEPDIRGAKTIRQQLEKHRALPECSSCHAKIDAPGFALENFDASGKWREYYPQLVRNQLKDGLCRLTKRGMCGHPKT